MIYEIDKDGYTPVSAIEVNGEFGIRISVKMPAHMMHVFDWQAMRKTPDSYVDFGIREMIETIQVAYARIDPSVAAQVETERESFRDMFVQSGIWPIYMKQIPNEYCGRHCCFGHPWFIVTSKIGPIKIGWRKRVINIDWSESDVTAKAEVLFPSEDVTRMDRLIHAWSEEKAVQYLRVILGGATGQPST